MGNIIEDIEKDIKNLKLKASRQNVGTVTYTARTYGGDTSITMPIGDLSKELAKVVNLKFTFRVFKKS